MTEMTISPPVHLVTPKGFQATGIHAGLKRKRKDLALLVCDQLASAAAVYTTNQFQAAPIQVTKHSIAQSNGKLRAILINSGNANACTGEGGMQDAWLMREAAASFLQCPEEEIAIASTGVIGQRLPMERLLEGIPQLQPTSTELAATSFADAILTTDTCRKTTGVHYLEENEPITLAGVAKGSGMIHPNMATMLGFVTTDAVIDPEVLQLALKQSVDVSFNNITVDGDSSTNDMVLVLASGRANMPSIQIGTAAYTRFVDALTTVCQDLAKQIARDGEGATTLIEVKVSGANDAANARKIAKQVVGSSLVKTAVYGNDANWGRIIAAIGATDVPLDPRCIDIQIGSQHVMRQSVPVAFDETVASLELAEDTVTIQIDLHSGEGWGVAYGCDLTYDYVKINASYRT